MTLLAAFWSISANFSCAVALAQPSAQSATPPIHREKAETLTETAREDLLSTPLGWHDLRVLNLPEGFARRAADRVLRAEYQSRFHVVAPDPAAAAPAATTGPADGFTAEPAPPSQPPRSGRILLVAGAAAIGVGIAVAVLVSRKRRVRLKR